MEAETLCASNGGVVAVGHLDIMHHFTTYVAWHLFTRLDGMVTHLAYR